MPKFTVLLFVFNFNPVKSFTDYGLLVPRGIYRGVLGTDNPAFGGQGLSEATIDHYSCPDPLYRRQRKEWLRLYIPARTAVVLKRSEINV